MLKLPSRSFFLFGPRGTGKTTWLKTNFPDAIYLDLLESELFNDLLAQPQRLEKYIPAQFKNWIIIDEVQRVPELLQEVHRLIENRKLKFILTGSSARKIRRKGVNLLAGRALTYRFYPLTAAEIGNDFRLKHAVQYGGLPTAWNENQPEKYLESYVATYLREEIQQEGLTRNLAAFSRFLEVASFSQGQVLNISEVARECNIHRKVAESYFAILEDLMIGERLPAFTKRSKRRLQVHDKFYFFDTGVYRTLRPQGPLDRPEEVEGVALETLVFHELKAINDYLELGYKLHYWRTPLQHEVDFILYGKKTITAIEVKRTGKINTSDLRNMRAFLRDYPNANGYIFYQGKRVLQEGKIQILPIEQFFKNSADFLRKLS
jgi:predicted AAA+ superfamily ATPase